MMLQFVNLFSVEILRGYYIHLIVFYAQRFPVIDFDELDLGEKLPAPVNTLNQMLEMQHRVYVHCNAGICRAPATVLTYLCHFRGMTPEEGLAYLRKERPQVHPYMSAVNIALDKMG